MPHALRPAYRLAADLTEASYFEVIQRKTAKLFEASTRLGAIIAGASPEIEDALARYGAHLGTAFQLVDEKLETRSVSCYDRATGRPASKLRPAALGRLPIVQFCPARNQTQPSGGSTERKGSQRAYTKLAASRTLPHT